MHDLVTFALGHLLWLPVNYRILFKLCTIHYLAGVLSTSSTIVDQDFTLETSSNTGYQDVAWNKLPPARRDTTARKQF